MALLHRELHCEGFQAEIQGVAVGGIKYHFVSVSTVRLSKSGLILKKKMYLRSILMEEENSIKRKMGLFKG